MVKRNHHSNLDFNFRSLCDSFPDLLPRFRWLSASKINAGAKPAQCCPLMSNEANITNIPNTEINQNPTGSTITTQRKKNIRTPIQKAPYSSSKKKSPNTEPKGSIFIHTHIYPHPPFKPSSNPSRQVHTCSRPCFKGRVWGCTSKEREQHGEGSTGIRSAGVLECCTTTSCFEIQHATP